MEEELEAELEESAASARLTSNAGSNAGVAVGPLRFARPRSRGERREPTICAKGKGGNGASRRDPDRVNGKR